MKIRCRYCLFTLISLLILGQALLLPSLAHAIPYLVLAVHSEQPTSGTTPATPNFTTASAVTYGTWRSGILEFANLCETRAIPWCFQSDWNFLEGVRRFETASGANYNSSLLLNGLNLIQYFQQVKHVEVDPHSHENNPSYNYADIAWLLDIGLSAETSGVVGGHVYSPDEAGYQNWPKFTSTNGLLAATHDNTDGTDYYWKPYLLMGAGSGNHRKDPHNTGMWRPLDANHYFEDNPNGTIATVGAWHNDLMEMDRLLRRIESGELVIPSDQIVTMTRVLNHRDLQLPTYRNGVGTSVLDTLKAWSDAGRIQIVTFEQLYNIWNSPPYSHKAHILSRPIDNVSFSLNWQDRGYPEKSIAELDRLLTYHESARVPVDVFLTTWQTEVLEDYAPQLLGRLLSSSFVNLAYHVRAPKPYANNYVWGATTTSTTLDNYESSHLDLVNGTPVTTEPGGYNYLKTLNGGSTYPPVIVGANADSTVQQTVHSWFKNNGASMVVLHKENAQGEGLPVNLGDVSTLPAGASIYLRPEHYDWKLIETYEATAGAVYNLDDALAAAQSSASVGGESPWFVGIKLHDNDLFAAQSWWTYVYNPAGRPKNQWTVPPWVPEVSQPPLDANPTTNAALGDSRRSVYTAQVDAVASRRATLNAMDARDMVSLLSDAPPLRPVGLSKTAIVEEQAINTPLAEISGGGQIAGAEVSYTLVNGEGDTDNAAFTLSGKWLQATARLDYETASIKHLRIRWADLAGGYGERALTLVLVDSVTDDDDGDGMTQEQETQAGTNPLDANSVFRVEGIAATGNTISISFQSVIGRSYSVETSTNLQTWSDAGVPPVTATSISTTFNLSANPTTTTSIFFRVKVAL
ncbi:MAG: hypothetical protein SFY80_17900 [Verrucomicrobiota bacterium]|nr:hypothetical protein [Verrucomicrobiota bacterium]